MQRGIDYYNLDAVISVGYRVNSSEATQFRIWATSILKEHLIKGYTTYEKRLAERGVKELQQTLELLQKTLTRNDLVNDIGTETIQLIMSYTKTWHLLLVYNGSPYYQSTNRLSNRVNIKKSDQYEFIRS